MPHSHYLNLILPDSEDHAIIPDDQFPQLIHPQLRNHTGGRLKPFYLLARLDGQSAKP